ncbi:ProQ/FINO family protein [Klebsiella variicola]|uniref:ProQ/FINO family protein n=1 Tax=Klebsiella variicola TaxID=244366 RepID=UPI0015B0A77D|nr:ProQ/FINO family protein [Klebsiella variicola]
MNQKNRQILTLTGNIKSGKKRHRTIIPGHKYIYNVSNNKIEETSLPGNSVSKTEITEYKKERAPHISQNITETTKNNETENSPAPVKKVNKTPQIQTAKRKGKARRHLNYTKRCIKFVFSHFPALKDYKTPLPLALNIHLQMMDYMREHNLPLSEEQVKKALRYYTLQNTYHLALLKYNWRRDIYGKKTTPLTAEEKKNAALRLRLKK